MKIDEDKHPNMKHMIMMILACVIPLAIIIVLQFSGISSQWTTVGAIGLMIFLHFFIMKYHFSNYHKGGAK